MKDMMDSRNNHWDKDTGKKKAVPYHCSQCRVLESSTGGKLRMCSCKTVYYCGVECQKAHFKTHKMYCSAFLAKKEKRKEAEKTKQTTSSQSKEDANEDVLRISKAVLEAVRNTSASDNIDEDSPLVKGKVDVCDVLECLGSNHNDIDHEFRRGVMWLRTNDNGIQAMKTLGGMVSVLAYQCIRN